jgi:hypothetical protein
MAQTTMELSEAVSVDRETLYRDGIVALKSAFPLDWVERIREDMMTAFWDAIRRPGGAAGRGPRRWYVEIHPQAFSGFADLCAHPWVTPCAGPCSAQNTGSWKSASTRPSRVP